MSGAVVTKKGSITLLWFSLALLLVFVPVAHANVVVFDRYDTKATITGNTITIERDVRIKNIGQTPIIPGEVHFRLYQQRGDTKSPIVVTNFEAYSARGEQLTTRVLDRSTETDMSVHLWNPLLPNFFYDFTMTYEMEFEPSGIFFYEIRLPKEDTTIPIVNENTQFFLDRKYSVTYAPQGEVSALSGNTVVSWDKQSDSRIVEYSRIPLPTIGVRAVNIFWMIIIVLLVTVFMLTLMRKRNERTRPQTNASQPIQPMGGWQQQPQQRVQQPYYAPQQHPTRAPPPRSPPQQRYGPR